MTKSARSSGSHSHSNAQKYLLEDQKQQVIEDAFETSKPTPLFGGQITLNPTISKLNFASYLLLQVIVSFVVTTMDGFQINLLKLRYKVDDVYTVNTIVLIFDMIFKLIISPFYGYLCDKLGRRVFVIYGLISFSVAAFLYQFFDTVYPYFIFARLIFANGIIAIGVSPLLADYVDFNSKGRMSGALTLMGSFSGFLASNYEAYGDLNDLIRTKLVFLSLGVIFVGLLVVLGVKGGNYHKALYNDPNAKKIRDALEGKQEKLLVENPEGLEKSDDVIQKVIEEENSAEKPSKLQMILEGFKQAKNPWILIGFMITFLGVAQGGILTFVLTAWVNAKINDPDPDHASTQAYNLSSKAMLALLFSSMIFGFSSDKYSKFKLVLFTLLSAMSGALFLILAPNPFHWLAYASMVFTGIGNSGSSVAMNTLVNKYAEPRYRAVVASAGQIMHVLGFANSSMLGVYLVKFSYNYPLYIYLSVCGITTITLIFLYSTNKAMRKI